MKAHLLVRDADLARIPEEPAWVSDLVTDLGLDIVIGAMSGEDEILAEVARVVLTSPLDDKEAILYRQAILADCLSHPRLFREMYDRSGEAMAGVRRIGGGLRLGAGSVLSRSVGALRVLLPTLKWLRGIADGEGRGCASEGVRTLIGTLATELDDEFFREVDRHLQHLRFQGGTTMRVRLGTGAQGTGYELLAPLSEPGGPIRRLFSRGSGALPFQVPDRDEAGARALSEIRARGLADVAGAVSQSVNHIVDFLTMLRTEVGFYVGCLNLYETLERSGRRTTVPTPLDPSEVTLACRDLRDLALSLSIEGPVIGNDVDASRVSLIVVTGANRGGKSTFLRSLGQAQVMMQAGMFVAAEEFASSVAPVILTHFTREEDVTLTRGKLDEELHRMSGLVDRMSPDSLILCNESFSSTNEREGSEIARQVVKALRGGGVRIVFVTHLYDLAHGWYLDKDRATLFLRAEREDDESRTFRLKVGEPLSTSYGGDLYRQIFTPGVGEPSLDQEVPLAPADH